MGWNVHFSTKWWFWDFSPKAKKKLVVNPPPCFATPENKGGGGLLLEIALMETTLNLQTLNAWGNILADSHGTTKPCEFACIYSPYNKWKSDSKVSSAMDPRSAVDASRAYYARAPFLSCQLSQLSMNSERQGRSRPACNHNPISFRPWGVGTMFWSAWFVLGEGVALSGPSVQLLQNIFKSLLQS